MSGLFGTFLDPSKGHVAPNAGGGRPQQTRGFGVGLAFEFAPDQISLVVAGLEPGLSAKKSGLIEEGDEIVKVDGVVVEKAPMSLLRERVLGPQVRAADHSPLVSRPLNRIIPSFLLTCWEFFHSSGTIRAPPPLFNPLATSQLPAPLRRGAT